MTKRLLVLLPIVLLLAACDLSSVPFLPGPSGETVEWRNTNIHVRVDPSAEFIRPELTTAAQRWSAAKYVNVSVLPKGAACSDPVCPTAWGFVGTTSYLSMGWGVCTSCRFHEDYGRSDGRFDTRWPTGQSRLNGVVHELGHMLSLDHGNVTGPSQNGWPTAWDLAVVDAIHDPNDL